MNAPNTEALALGLKTYVDDAEMLIIDVLQWKDRSLYVVSRCSGLCPGILATIT